MTDADKLLAEIGERIAKATPKVFWRVTYPPSDYAGDEWDLLRCPRQDFDNEADARAFQKKTMNKRVPAWGQPHVHKVTEITTLPQSARTALETLVKMVKCAMDFVNSAAKCDHNRIVINEILYERHCDNCRRCALTTNLDRIARGEG